MHVIAINLNLGSAHLPKGLFKYQEVRGRRGWMEEGIFVYVEVCVLFAPVCHKPSKKERLDCECCAQEK